MCKANSHQFKGTRGQRIAQGLSPSNQKEKVTAWAEDMVKYLEGKSKRQREKFKTACVAFDEATGNLYFGRNKGINHDASNVEKNRVLFGDINNKGILPEKSLNDYPTSWNCAETDAINKALNAGAKLKNIHIYTINTLNSNFGKPKSSCENCTEAYKDRIKANNTGWYDKEKEK